MAAKEPTHENYDLGLQDATLKKTNNIVESIKCNTCDCASFHAGNLRVHFENSQ